MIPFLAIHLPMNLFARLCAGVCLEFCVVTRRLDLLFGQIFRCFYEARYINVSYFCRCVYLVVYLSKYSLSLCLGVFGSNEDLYSQ